MNDSHLTHQKPARATVRLTALLLIGIGLMGAVAALPSSAAVAAAEDPCHADDLGSVAVQANTCGPCNYWRVGGTTIRVGPVTVYLPLLILWKSCKYEVQPSAVETPQA